MFNKFFQSNIEINADEIKDQTDATKNNNDILLTIAIIISCFLLFLILLLITLFNTICVKNILLMRIIALNICVYFIIGVIEIIFFNNIGMKYIPINESEILEVIKTIHT